LHSAHCSAVFHLLKIMEIHSDSERNAMDPQQLPLQSDIERLSNVDIGRASDHEENPLHQKLELVHESDATDDSDNDIASKPMLNDADNRPWYHSPKNWVKLNVVFFLIALLIAALSQPMLLWSAVQALLQWMELHIVAGSAVFMSLYIACELLMFPCVLLLFGAGFVFSNVLHSTMKGLVVSTSIVFVAELIASTAAFLMARYLLRRNIKSIASKYPKFAVIDAAVKRHGFRVTLLFRMSPLTPYNLFNYFMGLTSVRLMDYSMASVGIVPNFAVLCFMGGSLHHIYQLSQIDLSSNIPLLAVTALGFVFVVGLVVYGTRFIRRELAKISQEMKAQHEADILSSEDNAEQQPLTEYDFSLDIDSVSAV